MPVSLDDTGPAAVVMVPKILQVAAGRAHTVAVACDGTVWAWGEGDTGQLGNGNCSGSLLPNHVQDFLLTPFDPLPTRRAIKVLPKTIFKPSLDET